MDGPQRLGGRPGRGDELFRARARHSSHRLLAMDVVFDAMTPCGENGRFCRERVFGDGDDADAATRPCFQARLAVEKSVFGQEESTEMVLDAICDAFREMDHAEEEDENDLANRKPLVMSLHGSPGGREVALSSSVGESGVRSERRKKEGKSDDTDACGQKFYRQ